ncbi:hypothetical protein SELMODRAFT_136149, partial [Selaginella moellendorffii]
YKRLLPCPSTQLGPRIEHLLVKKKGTVLSIVSEVLKLPSEYVADLMSFGAVHHALRCPKPPLNLTPQQVQLFKKASPKKWPVLDRVSLVEARKPERVTDPNHYAEPGSYIRVHVHPKRFPRCYEVDWRSRIIANEESFVVLNKPAGVSVGGSVDNVEEICSTFATRALNLEQPLVTTHQLDNCTEGCLLLAKNNEFASRFHRFLKENKVEKFYLALAAAPVPLGKTAHYMRSDKYPPRIMSNNERLGWQLCVMHVLECKQVPWPSEAALSEYQVQPCGWTKSKFAYECRVKLLTGLTHQLRAQFSALGSPLIGDSLYMPAAAARLENPELDPFLDTRKKEIADEEAGIEKSPAESKQLEKKWISLHGSEPLLGIGLQSCEIGWKDEGEVLRFRAGKPWWRTEEHQEEAATVPCES